MRRRPLGRTGIEVSELCLGTMTFGREADVATSASMVGMYLDVGGNFVDTADVYGRGIAEEIVGRALGRRRDDVVLGTKGRMPMGDPPLDGGASAAYLTRAVDASLRRLGTDRIDLYQIHWPDPTVAPEETFEALDALVRAGKIRAVGVSNYLGSMLQRAIDVGDRYGWSPVACHQAQYSLVHREIELETLPLCVDHGIAVLSWSPLGGGVLTAKYRVGESPPAGTRLAGNQTLAKLTDHGQAIAAEVAAIAGELGRTPAQVALNWVLGRPGLTAPIIGARTPAQLQDNLGCAGWRLDPEHVGRLDAVSAVPLPYPQATYQLLGIARYQP